MSDEAISQLNSGTQLIVPARDDVLPITDISDTTESANGTTKPIEPGNFFNELSNWILTHDGDVLTHDGDVLTI